MEPVHYSYLYASHFIMPVRFRSPRVLRLSAADTLTNVIIWGIFHTLVESASTDRRVRNRVNPATAYIGISSCPLDNNVGFALPSRFVAIELNEDQLPGGHCYMTEKRPIRTDNHTYNQRLGGWASCR